ncbi:MAG TPA: hypothetical protein VGO14_02775 [Solirubrobacteraceae bacterium]|jgi:hypothetical protein|nr:hypothetical protein [Solirubrobacteraceae bacterium]
MKPSAEHPTDRQVMPAIVPGPPSERGPWLLACTVGMIGVALLAAVLTGALGRTSPASPPPILFAAATPTPTPAPTTTPTTTTAPAAGASSATTPGHGTAGKGSGAPIVARPSSTEQRLAARRLARAPEVRIEKRWMEGFYPIYATAQRTFTVNWLLLASIHMQESAFSTAPSTYHGLNFAHCCGGPMQFNVTNGRVTTWDLVSDSYRYGSRPGSYGHMTAAHPSIYDDFDSIMAAARLLSADGASYALDGATWGAAYAYYGHDATGVLYADEVLARAIGWSQHGFCFNCGVEPAMVQAVHGAYGAPVLLALRTAAPRAKLAARARGR